MSAKQYSRVTAVLAAVALSASSIVIGTTASQAAQTACQGHLEVNKPQIAQVKVVVTCTGGTRLSAAKYYYQSDNDPRIRAVYSKAVSKKGERASIGLPAGAFFAFNTVHYH